MKPDHTLFQTESLNWLRQQLDSTTVNPPIQIRGDHSGCWKFEALAYDWNQIFESMPSCVPEVCSQEIEDNKNYLENALGESAER